MELDGVVDENLVSAANRSEELSFAEDDPHAVLLFRSGFIEQVLASTGDHCPFKLARRNLRVEKLAMTRALPHGWSLSAMNAFLCA